MTGSAGFTGIHVTHGYRLFVGACRHYLVMAVFAEIAASKVNLVAESDRFDILLGGKVVLDGFEHRMTLLAVGSNSKSVFAVMTEPA